MKLFYGIFCKCIFYLLSTHDGVPTGYNGVLQAVPKKLVTTITDFFLLKENEHAIVLNYNLML